MTIKKIDQAVILAGGIGKRLKPITNSIPKPLANINGSPFLDYLIKSVRDLGINKILILTGYKSDKIIVKGNVFDAEPLLKSLYKKTDRRTFSKKFNSDIEINFDQTITGTNDIVSNFTMIASINKGVYNKLSLKGNYSENEIIEMSIYQVDNDKKTVQVISDRAKPFNKNFDFIEGFEGGKLEYESIISSE